MQKMKMLSCERASMKYALVLLLLLFLGYFYISNFGFYIGETNTYIDIR